MFQQGYTFYTSRGWDVVPVDGKIPLKKFITGRYEDRLTEEEATKYEGKNIAIRMTETTIGIDVDAYDSKAGGMRFANLIEALGPLPETWKTTSREDSVSGIYWFRLPSPVKLRSDLGHDSGIEIIQHHHRFAVVTPSIHPKTGQYYRWYGPEGKAKVPTPADLPDLPAPWIEYLKKTSTEVSEPTANVPVSPELQEWADAIVLDQLELLKASKPGSRNNATNLRSFFIGQLVARDVISEQEARIKLRAAADVFLRSEESERDSIYHTIDSGLAGGMKSPREPWPPFEAALPPRQFEQTGFGLADRFSYETTGRVRWVRDEECWAVFTGQEWRIGGNLVEYEARKVIEKMGSREGIFYSSTPPPAPPKGTAPKSDREEFQGYCFKLRDLSTGILPTLNNARSLPKLSVSRDDFDADPWAFKALNGVLNLKSRELRAFSKDDLMTKTSGAVYDPDATCPEFLKYLEKVQPDPEIRAFLQRWLGYCLTGLMSEQKFVIHQGQPGTGKSVFLDVCVRIMGDYYATANPDVFHRTTQSQHLTGIASLAGARFIQSNESMEGRKLDEARVNSLVSQEPVVARKMGQDEWTFIPTGKINYVTNHKPGITATSGVWRRLALVRWNVVIPPSEIVQDLGEHLASEELSGILNWALEGLDDWREGVVDSKTGKRKPSLKIPLTMQMEVDEYQADEDWLASYVFEKCTKGDSFKASNKELHKSYLSWAFDSGEKNPLKMNSFTKALEEAGYKRYRTGGERGFEGLKIISEPAPKMEYGTASVPDRSQRNYTTVDEFMHLIKED